MLDASGAHDVFGLSAGAVIAIETALVRPDITKLALYEPPLSFDGVVHGQWLPRYERDMAEGRPGAALATVLKGTADRGTYGSSPASSSALSWTLPSNAPPVDQRHRVPCRHES